MAETIVFDSSSWKGSRTRAAAITTPCIHAYDESQAARWDAFVRNEPSASFFHLSGWQRVMEHTFGYRNCAAYAERHGHITGVLPLFLIRNWILGNCLISTPFAVYGGVAAADDESYEALLGYAKHLARMQDVQFLELRNRDGQLLTEFHPSSRHATFTCELDGNPEVNLKRLPRDTRYMIRKAGKLGLTARHDIDQLEQFYELFAMNFRRHGTPMLPRDLLFNLLNDFPNEIDLLMVYSQGKPVSGVLTFLFGDTVLPHYSGASPEAPQLAANNFMYWELMRWAAERGYRYFDFGRSKTGTGAYFFKTQWNMKISPLPYQVFLVRKKSVPDFSPANRRFELATQAWARLPLWLTKQAGPHVVRWFP
jgi:FemAB-related protein (PEP-CTERM system-associated)